MNASDEVFARELLIASGCKPQYVNHALSILMRPENFRKVGNIARFLREKTCPHWFYTPEERAQQRAERRKQLR